MHLEDFHEHMDPTIVDRGYEYYFNGQVESPELTKEGKWSVTVYGTEAYKVQIQTDPENTRVITGWQCDCPYDYGPVCKHIAAVFFMMDEKMEVQPVSSGEQEEATPKGDIRNIFDRTSREDLQKFIQHCIESDDQFKNRFVAYFAERIDDDTEMQYRKAIQHYAKAAQVEFGFIDIHSAPGFTIPLQELNQKAKDLFEAGEIAESMTICRVLIEEVASMYQDSQDYEGDVANVVSIAFKLLFDITEIASTEIKEMLFEWCIQEFPKPEYEDIDLDIDFLTLLPYLVNSSDQEERFFSLLDQQVKAVRVENRWTDYQEVRLIKTKLMYLRKQNRMQEVRDLLNANIRFPEFREQLVDGALENKEFEEAKKLCRKGVEVAKERNHYGTVSRWQEKLFQIARLENDVPEIRKWAEKLFFESFFNMEWYRILKATYSKQEWPEKCEEIIDRMKDSNQRGGYRDAYTLAEIFKEEGYTDRLLKLLRLNALDLYFVDDFTGVLKKKYPEELLDMYEQGITEQANQTGRKHYRQLAAWLRKMKKISGGDERAYVLYERLLREYSNRPAMKQELGRVFRE